MNTRFEKLKTKLSNPKISYPLGITLGLAVATLGFRADINPIILNVKPEHLRTILDDPEKAIWFKHAVFGRAVVQIQP